MKYIKFESDWPIDDLTSGKVYQVISTENGGLLSRIKDDSLCLIGVINSKSHMQCAHLPNGVRWVFCDKNGMENNKNNGGIKMCTCKNDKCVDCGSYYFGEQKKDKTKMESLICIYIMRGS